MSHQTSDLAHPQGFASTRWSLVLAAGRGDAPGRVEEELRHLFEAVRARPS